MSFSLESAAPGVTGVAAGADRFSKRGEAVLAVLRALAECGYEFVTPTPATHQRVVARSEMAEAHDLRGVFGWNLPFAPAILDPALRHHMQAGDLLEPAASAGPRRVRSRVRISTLEGDLYAHSSFPTEDEDSVFFGPDSYRFAALIAAEVARLDPAQVAAAVDVGTGAGVGAIVLKRLCPGARVIGTDVNAKALALTAVNAAAAGVRIETVLGNTSRPLGCPLDLVTINPPYIIDSKSRAYRDGGDLHGAQVAIDMAGDLLGQLSPRGVMILYTGAAIVSGEDALKAELTRLAEQHGRTLRYRSLDPDVFGEELEKAEYRDVERIELVAAVFAPPG